jgi:multicomponent Na+:H+ antiporter subunit D
MFTFFYRISGIKVKKGHPIRLSLIQFMVAGTNLAFSTGDFFNLFVAYEIMLIASYAIFTLDAKDNAINRIFPYLIINLIGSTLFLCTAGFIYAVFGTLNFAHIASIAPAFVSDARLIILSLLILCVFGIKSGFFPLYYWLPNSYPTLPPSTIALFSATLTEVGLYSIIRIFGTVFPPNLHTVYSIIIFLSVPTMLFGIITALIRRSILESLCLQLVCQIGFIMLAMGYFTQDNLSACIFYIVHHIFAVSSLLLMGGIMRRLCGSDDLNKSGNLWKYTPFLGVLFLVQAFSLSGLPPFSGFWGKFWILNNLITSHQPFLAILMLLISFLTLGNMIKIWMSAYWKSDLTLKLRFKASNWRQLATIVTFIVLISVSIGVWPEFLAKISKKAAFQLTNKTLYIKTVLGEDFTSVSLRKVTE